MLNGGRRIVRAKQERCMRAAEFLTGNPWPCEERHGTNCRAALDADQDARMTKARHLRNAATGRQHLTGEVTTVHEALAGSDANERTADTRAQGLPQHDVDRVLVTLDEVAAGAVPQADRSLHKTARRHLRAEITDQGSRKGDRQDYRSADHWVGWDWDEMEMETQRDTGLMGVITPTYHSEARCSVET